MYENKIIRLLKNFKNVLTLEVQSPGLQFGQKSDPKLCLKPCNCVTGHSFKQIEDATLNVTKYSQL